MTIYLAKDLYPKSVILKAAYTFTHRAYIYIYQEQDNYIVEITDKNLKDGISENEFKNELLSQSLRYEIFMQTKDLRETIAVRALASTIVGEETPIISTPDNYVEEDILKDWFDKND